MRPSRITVAVAGSPFVFGVDYFKETYTVEAIPTGGSSYWVEQTADDVQDTSFTPTWFPITNLGTSGTPLVANALVAVSLSPTRFLRFNVTVAGQVAFTVLQGSGNDGVAPGDPYS